MKKFLKKISFWDRCAEGGVFAFSFFLTASWMWLTLFHLLLLVDAVQFSAGGSGLRICVAGELLIIPPELRRIRAVQVWSAGRHKGTSIYCFCRLFA